MGFFSSGKQHKSLIKLKQALKRALMEGDDEAADRIRAEIEALKEKMDKSSSKKKPLSKKKSMVS